MLHFGIKMRYALKTAFSCVDFLTSSGSKMVAKMLLQLALISLLSMLSTWAEAPLNRLAPYPAAGWRPDKAFNLPDNYLPPRKIITQQQQPQQLEVEIKRQRIVFAGQIQSNDLAPANKPEKAYLPPSNHKTVYTKVQELPNPMPASLFRPQKPQHFFKKPQNRQQQQQFAQRLPAKPNLQQQSLPAIEEQQKFADVPAAQYGPPVETEPFTISYPEPRVLDGPQENEADDAKRAAIEALNAAIDAYNSKQDAVGGSVEPANSDGYPAAVDAEEHATQGQYYVLGPNKRLQLVKFTTSQNEQEARNNGFTAHLKYTPVGEISGPLYKYNNRGQLVRIFKK